MNESRDEINDSGANRTWESKQIIYKNYMWKNESCVIIACENESFGTIICEKIIIFNDHVKNKSFVMNK